MSANTLIDRLPRHLKMGELRVFVAVMEHRSFRKAAAALHITQPAVTKAIAGLEALLEVKLFDRNAHGVEPTVHGLSFAPHAIAIFGELRGAAQALAVVASGAKGSLRVGTVPMPGVPILPLAIRDLVADHPDVFVSVVEARELELAERLRKREIELAIFRLALFNPGADLRVDVLFEERLAVLAGVEHPLAKRATIGWQELLAHKWVMAPADSSFLDHVRRTLGRLGMELPRHAVESTSTHFQYGMVLHGGMLSFGLRSQYAFAPNKDFLVKLPVDLPSVMGAIGAVTLKSREPSPLARQLVGKLRGLVASHVDASASRTPASRTRPRRG
jgi:DNA-binding transcriptional LysR family regulator